MDALYMVFIEASRAVITAYAVYAIIVGFSGMFFKAPTTWLERIEAIGGFAWVAGQALWRSHPTSGGYDIDLFLRSLGVALMLLPRVMLIAHRAFAYDKLDA